MYNPAEKFRPIFERFQNLNLIVLLEDLNRNKVAMAAWKKLVGTSGFELHHNLCPIAHGWSHHVAMNVNTGCASAEAIGVSVDDVNDFIGWWDLGWYRQSFKTFSNHLKKLLQSILDERLADADVVQEVIKQEEVLI
jgi:hypothetical protein